MKTTTLCRSVLPVLLLATAGSHPLIAKNIDKRKHDPRLVGLWKESDYYVHTVILRTADGFYKEKHLWFKGFHKPGDFMMHPDDGSLVEDFTLWCLTTFRTRRSQALYTNLSSDFSGL